METAKYSRAVIVPLSWKSGGVETAGGRGLKTRETNLIYMCAVVWKEELWLGGCEREKLTLSSSILQAHLSLCFT